MTEEHPDGYVTQRGLRTGVDRKRGLVALSFPVTIERPAVNILFTPDMTTALIEELQQRLEDLKTTKGES